MDAICSPEMPRRTFLAIIAGGLLAAPLAVEGHVALAHGRVRQAGRTQARVRSTVLAICLK
jgi:hypothetical protein